MKILIMGLPGSGKTNLTQNLVTRLEELGKTVTWLNADKIRDIFNDWDFSYDGRIRQAVRMKYLADGSKDEYIICDFVAPLQEMRDIYNAEFTIWMDTISTGRFEDTNKIFEPPSKYDVRVTEQSAETWVNLIISHILVEFQDK